MTELHFMNEPKKSVRDMDTILVRLPDGVKDRIAQRARANGRSMGAEASLILETAVTNPSGRDVGTLIAEATNVVDELWRAEERAAAYQLRLDSIKDELRSIFGDDLGEGDPILHAVDVLAQGKLDFSGGGQVVHGAAAHSARVAASSSGLADAVAQGKMPDSTAAPEPRRFKLPRKPGTGLSSASSVKASHRKLDLRED